ncbi:MAG: hypothetical protein LBQ02_03345 [Candidatus Nomurabacteria bacterium]|jgi:predicted transcriptional regulator|nr:hypothetical protein [Candidatus Nomurabacteria bacterium]
MEGKQWNAQVAKDSRDWAFIVVLLVLCWPIGLLMLLRKSNVDRSATFKGGGVAGVMGWILTILGLFGMLGSRFEVATMITSAGLLTGGILLIVKSKQMNAKAKKYRLYISIVVNEGETSIDRIAQSAGMDADEVQIALQEMLDRGFFHGHINQKTRELVLAKSGVEAKDVGNIQFAVVRCENCGADNKVALGHVQRCAYCRSLIRTNADGSLVSGR